MAARGGKIVDDTAHWRSTGRRHAASVRPTSTALPPALSTSIPATEASMWSDAATAPRRSPPARRSAIPPVPRHARHPIGACKRDGSRQLAGSGDGYGIGHPSCDGHWSCHGPLRVTGGGCVRSRRRRQQRLPIADDARGKPLARPATWCPPELKPADFRNRLTETS
jgi:hypothetical protein